jgi:hypothetical protein
MRELHCLVRPDPRGWCVITRNRLHGRFHSKEDAIRAAIGEARKARAAGFYTTVKVQTGIAESTTVPIPAEPDGL